MTASAHQTPLPRLRTPICDLLGIVHPIVLGGMASGTSAELVAAVSDAGGLGILGVSGRRPAEIRDQTAEIRRRTSAPFGLNILHLNKDEENLDTALER